jgi:hypothetical protein
MSVFSATAGRGHEPAQAMRFRPAFVAATTAASGAQVRVESEVL